MIPLKIFHESVTGVIYQKSTVKSFIFQPIKIFIIQQFSGNKAKNGAEERSEKFKINLWSLVF